MCIHYYHVYVFTCALTPLTQLQLIFPFNHHVIVAVFSAAILTSIGMAMDFCLPVPADMKKKRGDQQIYIQKVPTP